MFDSHAIIAKINYSLLCWHSWAYTVLDKNGFVNASHHETEFSEAYTHLSIQQTDLLSYGAIA